MAELYAKPFETIETGYNPQGVQQGGQQSEMESYLSSLPPEERQAAIERINAPLSGEELVTMAGNDRSFTPTLEQYAEIEKYHKNHEISFIEGLGKIAEGGEQVMTDLSNAFGSFIDSPLDSTKKMPSTAVEAFAQGTRNFYGMLAESQNPDSILFGVKDFLNGTGTIEDRYNQYMKALNFNRDSADLVAGKSTLLMDKDMINPEITQAMSYIADPTLFVPFGKIASTGLRAVGLGERLTMAGAKAAAIRNRIIGGTIKWGAGQPLEFLGGAVRNTIDYGLEKGGQAFEATTGISGKEFAQTARMSGIGFSASAIAGHAVPYASTISDAYIAGSSARGFGEALTLLGDTMKKSPFGRGINSWAAESLAQAEKKGIQLSPHAKGLLNVLNAVDPLFGYAGAVVEGSSHGIMIGGALGYASGGEEGMYHGMGAGMALGGVGALAGKTVADVTGGTAVARRAVQAKMVIEGHKITNPEKAMFFEGMQKATEARGQDVDLVNGIIAGIDNVAPNFEFHALTPDEFTIEAIRKGYNPETGKFIEFSALETEFGGDRQSKSRAMYILRSVGGDFVGDSKAFLTALKKASAKDSANPNKPASNIPNNLRKYIDVAKTFEKLSKTQQDAILKEIDGQGDVATKLGGKTKLRDHYDALTWSEAWTDSLVKKFETDREGARKDIVDMLAQETKKNGQLTSKGRALTDKLRAEGFLDKEGKLLRERNLLQADIRLGEFAMSKGAVISRESDGKTHMYINLNRMGDETFPHELYHTIMRESPMKKHFTDSVVQKLLGVFDANGNKTRDAEVNLEQTRKFFQKYIDLTSRNDDGTLNVKKADETMKLVNEAIEEYKSVGKNKKISDKARGLLEHYTEEFGAYYFSHWLMGRNRNTLFFGGELKGIEGLVERTKDAFLDFWQTKVSKSNPTFDFSNGLNASFDRAEGLGRISSMDYFMRDMVRAASNANRDVFRPDSMSVENLRDFERSNGLRNLTGVDNNRRLNPREQVTQNIRLGKEAHKILTGLDKNLRTSRDTIDENGKSVITGRLSEAELDALVKGGIVPRAWADKVNQGYAMLDGTVSNVFSAGYLGKTEQTTDASYPRLTGKDVAFKNRKAVLFDVETKIKADGTFYTLFHTLDLAVIEQRGNHLWQNTDYKNLWNGDRSAMEADFFRYISNASKASTDNAKLDSAALLEKGDGLGAQRRDVLQQMAGMALQTGDAYKHQPIAVIPEGIRHSVTTFNIDGLTMPRVEGGSRYDINMGNAHKFIRENWQPDDMVQEATPNGRVFTHDSGFKFTQDSNGRVKSYDNSGIPVGTFGSIKEATTASKNLYNKAQENIRKIAQVAKQKEVENRKNLQPLDDATYEEAFRIGDMFKTKRMQEIIGDSKLVRQTFDEFLSQRVEELNSGKNEQEKGAILERLFNSEFKELIELESELRKVFDTFNLEKDSLAQQEQEIIGKIVEFGQEKKRLQQFSDPDARVDVGILEMYERIYKRKEEVNKRMSEIANKMHNEGINDLNSHYYITKRLLEKFNETGKLSEEAIAFALKPQLIKAYEANFETGKAVTFLANHGTPNHELMVSKTFNTAFLGRNTGSMSAFNATFFAGSKDTSIQYVGTPIPKTWVKDFIEARKYYVNNFSPEFRAKLESMLSSDTSKGVVQKVRYLMNNAHIEFPDDFKLKDTGRKTKEGEPYIAPQPETQLGYDIDGLLDRVLEGANDEGAVFGGVETYWKEAGREPYLLRNIVKMDNPLVHEYAKADFRDETFASVIQRAKDAGHDGVIFKNTRDGGGLDTIFASFAKNEDNKIFTLETTEDTRFAPRGVDEAGNKVKGGSEIEGRKYQPTEDDMYRGGRTYNQNSKKWKSGFIGLWAEQNPDRLKGYNIEFFQKEAGAYRIRLQDNSVKGRTVDVGHITAVVSGDTATISSKIADEYKGNKLSYALYSEMAERLRALGIRRVDGQIVNRDGVPIRVRERIIGDTRDYFSGKPIDQIEGAIRIREKQAQFGNMAGVDVYNRLDTNARYMPSEDIGSPQNVTKVHEWLNEVRNKGGDYTAVPMSESIKQIFGNLEAFKKARKEDMLTALEKAMRYGSQQAKDLLESVKSGKTPIKDAVDWIKKNGDFYTYNAELKDIRDERANLAKAVLRAMGEMRKISDKDGRRYNTEGEREHRNTMRQQPAEDNIPTRDQGFNRVYREITRSKKNSLNDISAIYLKNFGINKFDYDMYRQFEKTKETIEFKLRDGDGDIESLKEELDTVNEEMGALRDGLDDSIKHEMGYGNYFEDHKDTIERGISRIESIVDTMSRKTLDEVDSLSGSNRLDAVIRRELRSGFAGDISGDDIPIAQSFQEFAGRRYERFTLGEAFKSELYESTDYYSENKSGILVDILRSENKLTNNGLPQGDVNPQRIINLLLNKSGGDSKVYAEAKAIGLIDWLESKQEGKKQKKVSTKELIEFVEDNQMGLEIDPQLEQKADFGDTKPHVTGGETQANKGYRVYVVRMKNPKHRHGVEGHFKEAVVHVRTTIRTTKDGKKVMHIEEIQANNTASDILSPKQKELVAKEINILEEFQKQKDILIQERVDDQAAVDTDKTLHTLERSQLKAEIRERERKQRQQLIDKTANELFNSNPEFYKEQYNFNSQKTDDAYIDMLKGQISARDTNLIISERKTALNKVKNNAPLQEPKEWVKVAFRTVLRKALVEGVDRITVTPWNETPIQVGMKSKSAERFYGKTIADIFNSELKNMNSRLNVEDKSTSKRRARITEANVKLNESIQEVAKSVDVNAPNNGADVKKIFEYLHMADADLDNRFGSQMNTYMSSPYEFEKWIGFELAKFPNNYKGLDALEKAVERRAEKLRAYVEEEMSNRGAKTPSGKNVAAGSMSESEYLVDRSMGFDLTPEMRKQASKPQRLMQPAEGADWFTEQAIKARENQPMKLWSYPDTANFKKWTERLKFISNEEDANKSVSYDKGFVTTVYKGVNKRTFDRFSERSVVDPNERSLKTDPNFFIADKTAADVYAGKDLDVENLNEDAKKAASKGQSDMYYIKSKKPANLLSAHQLQQKNYKLFEAVNEFWIKNIKEDGHDVIDPRTSIDRFLLEIAMGAWLSPRGDASRRFKESWRMDNWINFHEHLLSKGYDSIVIFDNSVSKKAPTIIVPQETASVKASSNYGNFSKTDTRINFQPAEGWRDWKSEPTTIGSVIKNTAGYVIMVQKGKFKVYNPYKAIVGIYDSEEQAKRRVQKDEPKR